MLFQPSHSNLAALLLLALALAGDHVLASEGDASDSYGDGDRDSESVDRQDEEDPFNNGTAVAPNLRQINLIESFFGQVAKTVVYGGATFVQLNTHILCPLLSYETNPDDTDHPTLFVFNNPDNKEQAYRIYSDDKITENMIREARFDPNQMTVILVHGWLGGIKNELWLSEAKNAALRVPNSAAWLRSFNFNFSKGRREARKLRGGGGDGSGSLPQGEDFRPNVIIVDWSEFASGSLFTATRNSYKVSRRLGRLLAQLVEVGGLRPERMHCLGHSIGAHICGQAARSAFPAPIPGAAPITPAQVIQAAENRLGRITALDPGGFCYERGIRNESTYLGLRPSDALLVDAYYTNRSPMGNRHQVAQYNVRVNNANFQPACSVWLQPELAREYFRSAMRFLMGDSSNRNTDLLVCDHYFATRFAEQSLLPSCSYVAYACDSYRNFLRGQCGKCDSPRQCYTMDAEYQLTKPSVAHALEKIGNYSSLFDSTSSARDSSGPIGSVAYEDRPIYYLRVSNEVPYCSITFRIRVLLDLDQIDARTFRAAWMKLRLIGHQEEVASVRDASTGRVVDTIDLHGPWIGSNWATKTSLDKRQLYGIDNRTLTALIELAPRVTLSQTADGRFLQSPITDIIVIYDSENNRRSTTWNPIESIKLDYLSSSDPKIRSKNSRSFNGPTLQVYSKRP